MRIWIVNHYADPPEGMATRSYDIARRLVEFGHPTTVFASNFSHYFFRALRRVPGPLLWTRETVDGVEFRWIRTSPYLMNDWRRVLNMLSFSLVTLMAGLAEPQRPDVVIGVSVHPLAAFTGWLIAVLRRSRFWFEVTDLWPQTLVDIGSLRPDAASVRLLRALEGFLYRRAERIVMLMPNAAEYVESLGISRDKVLWIPNGVELDRYSGLKPYEGGFRKPFRIVFMGGFVSANNLDLILAAAAELKRRGRDDIRFLLVGRGTDREAVIRRAASEALDNVEFPPPVPKSEIASVMNQADAFIFGLHDVPLYRYGISLNKLGDYLAGGRPIIFSGRSAYDPVKSTGAGYSVPPDDPVAVADAVEELVALSPAERIEMGARGREYVVQNHNIPRLAERLLAALQAGRP